GDDIVVCDDASIDLTGLCPQPMCHDLSGGPSAARRLASQLQQASTQESAVGRVGDSAPVAGGQGAMPTVGDALAGAIVVDLVIQYQEEGIAPQASLGCGARGQGGQADPCEYSRTRETFKLVPTASMDTDPPTSPSPAQREYSGVMQTAQELISRL